MKRSRSTKPPCRHCGKKPAGRPRGLCWACYYTPGVKEAYPPQSKFAVRGCRDYAYYLRPLPEPTEAEPGTEAKVLVLAARADQGLELFHPRDPFLSRAAAWVVPSAGTVRRDAPLAHICSEGDYRDDR